MRNELFVSLIKNHIYKILKIKNKLKIEFNGLRKFVELVVVRIILTKTIFDDNV